MTAESSSAQTQQSIWELFGSLPGNPTETMRYLAQHPGRKWVLPFVLMIVVSTFSTWLAAPYASEFSQAIAQQQMAQSGLTPEQIEQAMASSAMFNSPLALTAFGFVGSLFIPLIWLLTATLFYLIGTLTGADEMTFGSMFAVVSWANIPLIFQTAVVTVLTILLNTYPVYPGLGALVSSGDLMQDSGNILIPILSFIDPFRLWAVFLLVVGVSVVTQFSTMKSLLIVSLYVALAIGLSALPLLFSGLAMGG
jgi:hypothetical protein